MPLDRQTLAQGLYLLDEPAMPLTPTEAVDRWFSAWWNYVHQMTYYNPGSVSGGRRLAHDAFRAALLPSCHVNDNAITFFLALERGIRQSLVILGTPAFLQPAYATVVPAPAPLAPQLIPTVSVGLASADKTAVRQLLARIVDAWTRTNLVQPIAPGPPLPYA